MFLRNSWLMPWPSAEDPKSMPLARSVPLLRPMYSLLLMKVNPETLEAQLIDVEKILGGLHE